MTSTQELLDSLEEGNSVGRDTFHKTKELALKIVNVEDITFVTIQVNRAKLKETILSQREKGFVKYGKYIEDTSPQDYNWEIMTIEEIADALVYYNHLKSLNNGVDKL